MCLVQLILHYENASGRIREKEAKHDSACSQSTPVPIADSNEIEVAASKVFTPENFYLLLEDLKKIGDLDIFESAVGSDSQQFLVTWKTNRKHVFVVDYTPKDPEETIKCSCRRMHRVGLPCKHILRVLKHLKVSEIPKCLVL